MPEKNNDSSNAGVNQGRFQGKHFNCGTWGHRAKFYQKSAGTSSEKSNQAMGLQQSEHEEPSYVLAMLNGTAKLEISMFGILDEGQSSVTEHTWIGDTDHHAIPLISLLICVICKVSWSLVKVVLFVCRQSRKGNWVAIYSRWMVWWERRFCPLWNIVLSQRQIFFHLWAFSSCNLRKWCTQQYHSGCVWPSSKNQRWLGCWGESIT